MILIILIILIILNPYDMSDVWWFNPSENPGFDPLTQHMA